MPTSAGSSVTVNPPSDPGWADGSEVCVLPGPVLVTLAEVPGGSAAPPLRVRLPLRVMPLPRIALGGPVSVSPDRVVAGSLNTISE